MSMKRKRRRVGTKLVSSTVYAKRKNPNSFNNIVEYTPDPKATEKRRKDIANKSQEKKFSDVWEAIKAEARNL